MSKKYETVEKKSNGLVKPRIQRLKAIDSKFKKVHEGVVSLPFLKLYLCNLML